MYIYVLYTVSLAHVQCTGIISPLSQIPKGSEVPLLAYSSTSILDVKRMLCTQTGLPKDNIEVRHYGFMLILWLEWHLMFVCFFSFLFNLSTNSTYSS